MNNMGNSYGIQYICKMQQMKSTCINRKIPKLLRGIKLQKDADSTVTLCKFELKIPSQNSALSLGNGCIYVCTRF